MVGFAFRDDQIPVYHSFQVSISLTQTPDKVAASRNPRARSIRVSPAVMQLVMVNLGANPMLMKSI